MIANIPQDVCVALGADPAGPMSPPQLLAELRGPSSGPALWLDLLGRATELASRQVPHDELCAALAKELDLGVSLVEALVEAAHEALCVARLAARAALRERLWDLATGQAKAGKDEHAAVLAAARQHLGWAGGLDASELERAVRAARAARGQ